MLVDFTQLILAMVAMLVAATAADLLRGWLFKQPGEQSRRVSDSLLVNLLFFVMAPAMLYAWFYPLVPFSGYRAGLFLGWCFFLLAVQPARWSITPLSRQQAGASISMPHRSCSILWEGR